MSRYASTKPRYFDNALSRRAVDCDEDAQTSSSAGGDDAAARSRLAHPKPCPRHPVSETGTGAAQFIHGMAGDRSIFRRTAAKIAKQLPVITETDFLWPPRRQCMARPDVAPSSATATSLLFNC